MNSIFLKLARHPASFLSPFLSLKALSLEKKGCASLLSVGNMVGIGVPLLWVGVGSGVGVVCVSGCDVWDATSSPANSDDNKKPSTLVYGSSDAGRTFVR